MTALFVCMNLSFPWMAWGIKTWMVPCCHKLSCSCFHPIIVYESSQKMSKKPTLSTKSIMTLPHSMSMWRKKFFLHQRNPNYFLRKKHFFKEIFLVLCFRNQICRRKIHLFFFTWKDLMYPYIYWSYFAWFIGSDLSLFSVHKIEVQFSGKILEN